MSLWNIVVPEETINYARNPSFETDVTTEWAKISGTDATRSTAVRMFGLASMALTAAAAGTNTAYRSDTVMSLAAGATVTVSAYAYRATGTPTGYVGIRDVTTSNTTRGTDVISVTGYWERLSCSWTNSTGGAVDIRILLVNTTQDGASIIYFDGVQCEVKASATTYCDGDMAGCAWNGVAHNATSTRSSSSRAGGRVYDLSDLGLFVEMVGTGLGMPPMRHIANKTALLPGSIFQRRQIDPQNLNMTIIANGSSRANLHTLRKGLINAVKPDANPDDSDFALQYQGANASKLPAELRVRYDTGLEWTKPDGFAEYIPLRVTAYDPFWREQGNDAAVIETVDQDTVTVNHIAQMDIPTGVWSAVGTGMNGAVDALMVGASGYWLYAAGNFTTAGGTTVNYVARYDRIAGTWSTMGATAGTNGRVRALAQTADGYVYGGGDFTTAGGTTVNYVGRWNGTAWAAMGATPGTNGAVYALYDSPSYYLLAGGAFTQAGGATANRIVRWNAGAWSVLGSGIPDSGTVYAIADARGASGTFLVGGSFATTYDYAAYFNGSAFSTVYGDDVNSNVRAIYIDSANRSYVFGDFTANGSIYSPYAFRYSGGWSSSIGGFDAAVYCYAVNPTNGNIWVGGNFSTVSGVTAYRLAKYDGSSWSSPGVVLPGNPTVTALDISPDGKTLYAGFTTTGDITAGTTAGTTTVTNLGTATAYPIIKIKRAGGTSATLRYIRNGTQDCTIYSGYALRDGETLIIDLVEKTVYSDFDGASVIGSVIERNSDFGRWGILPGVNTITTLVETVGSPTVTAHLEWKTTHWSADGAAV